jgi:SnoaL-like domain
MAVKPLASLFGRQVGGTLAHDLAVASWDLRVPTPKERNVVAGAGQEELVSGLVRIGEKELTDEDEAEVDAYFAPEFRFHGPDGRQWDYPGLKGYFAALRAAFDDLTITRGIVIVEGNYVACQTWIAGRFVRRFTHSPVGPPGPRQSEGLTG